MNLENRIEGFERKTNVLKTSGQFQYSKAKTGEVFTNMFLCKMINHDVTMK